VVQGMEIYQNKPIFYSLGNFIFDQYFSPDTQEGLAVGLQVETQNFASLPQNYQIFLFPFKSVANQVELLKNQDKQKFLKKFAGWSKLDEKYLPDIKSGKLIINTK
jgi:poly-gamma-glutamate capsule biosynthesis protein CapA/YwtB (metallophosphatase superfamily)